MFPVLHMLQPIYSNLPKLLSFRCHICKLSVVRMSGVNVRNIPNEEKLKISVVYAHNGGPPRTFNLERPKNEELIRSLTRLQQNIVKAVSKKKKKNKSADPSEEVVLPISLHKNGQQLYDHVHNSIGWVQGSELDICGTRLPVEVNLPTVNALILPSSLMAGFPIFPKVDIEFASISDCSFTWYRGKLKESGAAKSSDPRNKHKQDEQVPELDDVSVVSKDVLYTPSTNDIAYWLKVECIPKHGNRAGKQIDCLSKVEVSAGPGECPFENRQLYTQKETTVGSFRVVSYNILANLYSDSDFSRNELYPYCPPYALAMDYRIQLLLKEIKGYNSDIICLQECDRRVFRDDLLPALEVLGLDGWLKEKGNGTVAEGSATFYRRSKFRLVAQHDVILSEFLKEAEVNSDLWSTIQTKPILQEKMEQRSTILQVTILQSTENTSNYVCVANTHYYFHPRANNMRLLQAILSVRYLQNICQQYKQQEQTISMVFCGDFNSSARSGVNILMATGAVPTDVEDWKSGGEDEQISYSFSHNHNIKSACGYPDYTNYTLGFHGLLDYIFIDADNLEVQQSIPMPTTEEVTQHIALPSVVFPSDHIALIADLTWKSQSAENTN